MAKTNFIGFLALTAGNVIGSESVKNTSKSSLEERIDIEWLLHRHQSWIGNVKERNTRGHVRRCPEMVELVASSAISNRNVEEKRGLLPLPQHKTATARKAIRISSLMLPTKIPIRPWPMENIAPLVVWEVDQPENSGRMEIAEVMGLCLPNWKGPKGLRHILDHHQLGPHLR